MIDICLATKNRNDEFAAALEGLLKQTIVEQITLYVMDGNNDISNLNILKYVLGDRMVWHHFWDNELPNKPSWPRLYNFLAKQGKGQFVSYWSDDAIIVNDGLLEACVKNIGDHDAIAIAFKDIDRNVQPNFQLLDDLSSDSPVVNFGLIKRSVWEMLGGLDEDFDFYYADVWLATQIIMRGGSIGQLPAECGHIINNRHNSIWRNALHYNLRKDSGTYYKKLKMPHLF